MNKNTVKNIVSAGASVAADQLRKKALNASGWVAVLLWLATAVCVGVSALTSGDSAAQQQPALEEPPAIVSPADPAYAR